jgi:hypothetical protein
VAWCGAVRRSGAHLLRVDDLLTLRQYADPSLDHLYMERMSASELRKRDGRWGPHTHGVRVGCVWWVAAICGVATVCGVWWRCGGALSRTAAAAAASAAAAAERANAQCTAS